MDDFTGTDRIELRPRDRAIPYSFKITVCSAATANDGMLPFGYTVSNTSVTVHKERSTDATTQIVNSVAEASNVITVKMNYPVGLSTGIYHMRIVAITTDSTIRKELEFNRIYAKDI